MSDFDRSLSDYEHRCEALYMARIDAELDDDDYTALVRDALVDALEANRSPLATEHYVEWIGSNWEAFVKAIHFPGERSHNEVLTEWRERFADAVLSTETWQDVNETYEIGIE